MSKTQTITRVSLGHVFSFEDIENYINDIGNLEKRQAGWDIYSMLLDHRYDITARIVERFRKCLSHEACYSRHDAQSNTWSLGPYGAYSCHLPFCPVCASVRTNTWVRYMSEIAPVLKENFPTYKFVFLTISHRNGLVVNLQDELNGMNAIWKNFRKRKQFKSVAGWVKIVEIQPQDSGTGLSNPEMVNLHYHILLLVPHNFPCDIDMRNEWIKIWREIAMLDYNPNFHIEKIRNDIEKYNVANKVVVYSLKRTDLSRSNIEWSEAYILQSHGRQMITTGGILRAYIHEVREQEKQKPFPYWYSVKEQHIEHSIVHSTWDHENKRFFIDCLIPA